MKKVKIILGMMLLVSTSFGQQKLSPELNAITVLSPSLLNPIGSKDSTTIFYFPGIKLFKVKERFISGVYGESGSTITSSGEKTSYYAFDTAHHLALYFNENTVEKYDSTLLAFEHFHLPIIIPIKDTQQLKNKIILIDSSDQYNWIERMKDTTSPDPSNPDSAVFYYNKNFMQVDYAFGLPKEKELQLKLQKMSFFFSRQHPKWQEGINEIFDITYELKPVSQEAWDIAMTYYERAKKEFPKYLKE